MDDLLIGNDTAVITMLLLFITGLLTKRFVPWWVYEDVVKKLKEYEEAAPELITEVQRLMTLLEDTESIATPRARKVNPKRRRTTQREGHDE
jgi:hypothetical protein